MSTETQKQAIKRFFEVHTNHKADTAQIRKSPASDWDYVVKVEHHSGRTVSVNFAFMDGDIVYGIAGWGVCSVVPVNTLINKVEAL